MNWLPPDWPNDWRHEFPRDDDGGHPLSTSSVLREIRIQYIFNFVRQREMVRTGEIKVPNDEMLKRMLRLHIAFRFLNRVFAYRKEVTDFLNRLEQRGPR